MNDRTGSRPGSDQRAATGPPAANFAARLETGRLYLRPYRVADAAWYGEMAKRNHRHLARFESGNAAFGIADEAGARVVLHSFAELAQQRTAWLLGAFLKGTDEFVAQVYVGAADPGLPRFTIGFFADGAHEGRGYVTEAVRAAVRHLFAGLGAQKVDLWCDDTNVRCRRVAERCGFRLEAHRVGDQRHPDGTISGTCVYAIFPGQSAGNLGAAPPAGPDGDLPGPGALREDSGSAQ